MKLPETKIEAVCSKDYRRYTLNASLLDVEREVLVSTNGHALASIPAHIESSDSTGLISISAWKMAREAAKRIPMKVRSSVKASIQVLKHKVVIRGVDERTVVPKASGTFPSWHGLIAKDYSPSAKVCIDVNMLVGLADALCQSDYPPMVTLFVTAEDKIIGVVPERGEGVGVLMPIRSQMKTTELLDRWATATKKKRG